MTAKTAFDVIVVGSGIGGLSAAAALAKRGRRVLVLEKHFQIGGLTQTFKRGNYTFGTGVHYLGGAGEPFGRLLHWMTDGRLHLAPIASPYDIVEMPGLRFPIEAPREAFIARLKDVFPGEAGAIDAYLSACDEARAAALALFAANAAPAPIGAVIRCFNSRRIGRALETSAEDAVRAVRDRRLAALLTSRWGDYGVPPAQAPLAVHALVTGSYSAGAYFPVGGSGQFSETLGRTVRAAGGELRTDAAVTEISVAGDAATGVRLESGESIRATTVISDMGARNTLDALPRDVAPGWRKAVAELKSGLSYVSLYLGFRGDIRKRGASPSNLWCYSSHDTGRVWEHPAQEDAPSLFVSFPTLKDPANPDPERHTAEIVAPARWESFATWANTRPGHRGAAYATMKSNVAQRLLAQFRKVFPDVAPLMDFHEVSTPLSQASFVGAHHGAMYGLEMSAPRLASRALKVRTPVHRLFLAGQDAASPGVQGAFMGGFMAAAAVEPRLWKEMRT